MKAYVVSRAKNGIDSINGAYYLITEKGEFLASHWCSNKGFAISDLYLGRPERIKEYTDRFEDFQVMYLGDDDMTMEKILELNKKHAEENGYANEN